MAQETLRGALQSREIQRMPIQYKNYQIDPTIHEYSTCLSIWKRFLLFGVFQQVHGASPMTKRCKNSFLCPWQAAFNMYNIVVQRLWALVHMESILVVFQSFPMTLNECGIAIRQVLCLRRQIKLMNLLTTTSLASRSFTICFVEA